MPANEQAHEEWLQLVKHWHRVWDKWNEVMDRITLAFSGGKNPEQKDLDLEEQLSKELKAAQARMDEFRGKLRN